MWDSESESAGGRDYGNEVLTTSKHGLKTDGFEQRGKSWYVLKLLLVNLFCLLFKQISIIALVF